MTDPTCICFVRGCQGEAPEGCYFCAECFEKYAKSDPRMGGKPTEAGGRTLGPPLSVADRQTIDEHIASLKGGAVVNINFTVTNNRTSDDIARKVVQNLVDKRRYRNLPPPPDAA